MLDPDRLPRRSRLTLGDARAQELHRILLKNVDRLVIAHDVPGLPALRQWPLARIEDALDRLVAAGLVTEDEHGRFEVREAAA